MSAFLRGTYILVFLNGMLSAMDQPNAVTSLHNYLLKLEEEEKKRIDDLLPKLIKDDGEYSKGYTLWHWAARYNLPELTKLLIQSKEIDINSLDQKGNTPLYTALNYTNLNIAELLVEAGCEINSQNKRGDTVLHLAMKNGNEKAAYLLVGAGAHCTIKNVEEKTPVDLVWSTPTINLLLALNIPEDIKKLLLDRARATFDTLIFHFPNEAHAHKTTWIYAINKGYVHIFRAMLHEEQCVLMSDEIFNFFHNHKTDSIEYKECLHHWGKKILLLLFCLEKKLIERKYVLRDSWRYMITSFILGVPLIAQLSNKK